MIPYSVQYIQANYTMRQKSVCVRERKRVWEKRKEPWNKMAALTMWVVRSQDGGLDHVMGEVTKWLLIPCDNQRNQQQWLTCSQYIDWGLVVCAGMCPGMGKPQHKWRSTRKETYAEQDVSILSSDPVLVNRAPQLLVYDCCLRCQVKQRRGVSLQAKSWLT